MSQTEPFPVPDWLVVNAVRYATGRVTYVAQETVAWLVASWERLPETARKQIERDLEREFDRDDEAREGRSICLPLGMDMDRREWEKVRELYRGRP